MGDSRTNLPSTGDDNWDAWLRAFIEKVRQKQWIRAMWLLTSIQRQLVAEAGSDEPCRNPVYPGTDRCGACEPFKFNSERRQPVP